MARNSLTSEGKGRSALTQAWLKATISKAFATSRAIEKILMYKAENSFTKEKRNFKVKNSHWKHIKLIWLTDFSQDIVIKYSPTSESLQEFQAFQVHK